MQQKFQRSAKIWMAFWFMAFGLAGCQIEDGGPLAPPKTVVVEENYILGGEEGSRVTIRSYGSFALDGQPGFVHQYIVLMVPPDQLKLSFLTILSSSAARDLQEVNASDLSTGLEIAIDEVYDSIWVCDAWNPDSSFADRHNFNGQSHYDCGNLSRQFEGVERVVTPHAFAEGERIDGDARWASDTMLLSIHSLERFTTAGGPGQQIVHNIHRQYPLWQQYAGIRYLGFRWQQAGRFRYGYAELSQTTFHGIVVGQIVTTR